MDVVVVMVERRKIRERKKGRKDTCVRDIVKVYVYRVSERLTDGWVLSEVFQVRFLGLSLQLESGAVSFCDDDGECKAGGSRPITNYVLARFVVQIALDLINLLLGGFNVNYTKLL